MSKGLLTRLSERLFPDIKIEGRLSYFGIVYNAHVNDRHYSTSGDGRNWFLHSDQGYVPVSHGQERRLHRIVRSARERGEVAIDYDYLDRLESKILRPKLAY